MLLKTNMVTFAALFLVVLTSGCSDVNEFDTELWKAQRGNVKYNNPRANMIVELEKNYLRKGVPRNEVLELLGAPDDYNSQTDIYDIGASGFGVDLESYHIHYENELVISYNISRS